MFAPPGVPDVLSLAKTAYQLYDIYHGAQARFKGLCEDIRGLEIVLRRLGNKLIMQDVGSASNLTNDEIKDLEQLVQQARQLLDELQEKVPAAVVPRGLRRFMWSQSDVDSLRSRITALCSTLAAFNSSVLLAHIDASKSSASTQQQILRTLDDILIGVRSKDRPDSISSTLVEREDDTGESNKQTSDPWADLIRQIKQHGISETQIGEHREMILQWAARAAAAGILDQPLDQYSTVPEEQVESLEVISAVYGPTIVTSTIQRIFDVSVKKNLSKVQFAITNQTFQDDPFPNNVKAFSMVWRKIIRRGHKALYSTPQKVFAQEGNIVLIDPRITLPCVEYNDDADSGEIQILIASWHNCDVTEWVSTLMKNGESSIMATNRELRTEDPCPGYAKILSATWTYANPAASSSQWEVSVVRQGHQLEIPPYLNILCANWGGTDITTVLQTRTSSKQILALDTNKHFIAAPDPWLNVHKAISIVYQYDSNPLQLLVVGEGTGLVTIQPYETIQRRRRWHINYDIGGDIMILAVIWGLQPIPSTPTFLEALKEGRIYCTNGFFGLDGWQNVPKTCQVFVQNTKTREISCLTGRENSVLILSSTSAN
jgi:hypothetical protein